MGTFTSLGTYVQLTFGKQSKEKEGSFKQNHPRSFHSVKPFPRYSARTNHHINIREIEASRGEEQNNSFMMLEIVYNSFPKSLAGAGLGWDKEREKELTPGPWRGKA